MDVINTLPYRIMVQIFGNLSPNLIKCCTLVCKRWEDIIGNSPEIMKRFRFNSDEMTRSNRKYQAAEITRDQSFLGAIIGQELKDLKIHYAPNILLSTFIEILNEFPSLEVLVVNLERPIDDVSKSCNFQKVQANIKELDCSVDLIHIFDCQSIKKMKILWNPRVVMDKKMTAINFLRQQDNIEDLTVYEDYLSGFFTIPGIFELDWALKRLRLEFRHNLESEFPDSAMLIKFLDRHKESLTSLELNACTNREVRIDLVHDYALKNLVNLKHMEFGRFCKNEIEEVFPFVDLPIITQAARNIESVVIYLELNNIENDSFYAAFPNLKHLSMEDSPFIPSAVTNHDLETLNFWNYWGDTDPLYDFAYFPNLKELTFHQESVNNRITGFINRHSNTLEKITIKKCDKIERETTNAILNCADLQYLELGYDKLNNYIKRMIDEIISKSTKFTLKLYNRFMCRYHGEFTFVFPDDKAIWNDFSERLVFDIPPPQINNSRISRWSDWMCTLQ